MRCPECQHENPETNRFCGQCGALLPAAPGSKTQTVSVSSADVTDVPVVKAREKPVAAKPSEVLPRPARTEPKDLPEFREETFGPARTGPLRTAYDEPRRASVSGPSFLGLDDDEEEYRGRRDDVYGGGSNWGGRALLLLFLLVVLGGLAYMQWRSNKPLMSVLAPKPSPAQDQQPQQTTPQDQQNGQQPPQASPHNQPETNQPPQANNAQASSATTPQPNGASHANSEASNNAQTAQNSAQPSSSANQQQPNADENSADESQSAPAQSKSDQTSQQSPGISRQESKTDQTATAKSSASSDESASSNDEGDTASTPSKKSNATAKRAPKPSSPDESAVVNRAQTYIDSQNCDQGLSVLRSASSQGNTQALIKLGALYATGTCVPFDRVIAYHYFSRAFRVEPENTSLDHNRIMLWNEMSDAERQRAMAEDGSLDSQQ